MVVPESEFVQVQRQIALAHLVVAAHNSALEQAPEAFNRVRVRRADNVLIVAVVHGLMDESMRAKVTIASVFIGRHQRDFLRDGFLDEDFQRPESGFLNHLTDNVSLAADGSEYHRLVLHAEALPAALANVLVEFLAADIRFVRLDFTHQFLERFVLHSSTDARAHVPSRFVRAGPMCR